MRRSIEQFAANQDQSARKVEQIAQAITTLQAAGQDLSQKISTLSSQVVRVAPPKPVQPEGPVNRPGVGILRAHARPNEFSSRAPPPAKTAESRLYVISLGRNFPM
jgi:hypothetical protein